MIVIAGPNGSGKSTTAPELLHGALGVTEFVNADTIARGLSAFEPEGVALAAGRIMLARIKELAAARERFAFETTLASRSFAPWIQELLKTGCSFHLVYLWLPTPDLSVARVAERVRRGGHNVPEETIRRRYVAGLRNFFSLYQPLATTWRVYDNENVLALIASGRGMRVTRVTDEDQWQKILHQSASTVEG
ncbi:MAG TPA: AAA family ATPase [Planctomycetota bacterium]